MLDLLKSGGRKALEDGLRASVLVQVFACPAHNVTTPGDLAD